MPVINFKEIEVSSPADRDRFELFAREMMVHLGFGTEDGPTRGADGGRDFVAIERRTGLLGTSSFRWLVSCKHFAASDTAVGVSHEQDLMDRLERCQAGGFIGFYSTIPSGGLQQKLTELHRSRKFEFDFFDCERIERELVERRDLRPVFERFFPESYRKWNRPAWVGFPEYVPLPCSHCGQDLLGCDHALIAFITDFDRESGIRHYIDLYAAHKNVCDFAMRDKLSEKGSPYPWFDVTELTSPYGFMNWLNWFSMEACSGSSRFDFEMVEALQRFLRITAQLAMRPGEQSLTKIVS